jgi:hypothetical protein
VTLQTKYSVLQSWCLRPLPVALAHRFCTASFGDPQMEVLKRLYFALNAQDRNLCRTEFVRKLDVASPA